MLLKLDRGNGFYQENLIHLRTAVIYDIKTVIHDQAALVSEGRALMTTIDDCQKNQQISDIITLLNFELQSSSERLEELITQLNSA